MTNTELLHKNFTTEQINWLAQNGKKAQGNTPDEKLADLARQLFSANVYATVDQKKTLAKLAGAGDLTYELQNLGQAAGFSDYKEGDKTVTAGDQFYDAYFGGNRNKTDRDLWRVRIKDKFGNDGWKNAKKVLEGESRNRMEAQIVKDREELFDSMPGSSIVELFRPRAAKAMKEGRDPTWRENLGDIGEQALYAMPVGRAAGAVTGAARVLPGAARGAVKVLSNVAAQGAAPLAVSVMDDKLGNRDFDWTDVGIGTATNLGVNKGLARLLGPAYQLAMGKVRGRLPEGMVRFLEGGEPAKATAKNLVQEAYDKLKKHYAESNEDYLRKLARGETPNRLSNEELDRYLNIAHLGDYIKWEGEKDLQKRMADVLAGTTTFSGKRGIAPAIGKEPTWQLDLETAQNAKKDIGRMADDLLRSPLVTRDEVKSALNKDPILTSLFYRPTKREIANDLAGEMIQTYAVNKMGSDKDASIIGAAIPGGLNVKEIRKEQAKDREQKRQSGAAKVLGSWAGQQQGLTKEDQDFLGLIARKPEVIQGYGEGNSPRFRNWFLLRGQDLLRESGSDLFRPAFTTEH